MEVKINKEIHNYKENMFFGLSIRQFAFSLAAIGVAVMIFLLLKPYLGTEIVSWLCILGAVPFAAMGFFHYHGMTAEQFALNWFRTEILEPHILYYEPVNYYEEAINNKSKKRGRRRKHGSENIR